MKNKQRYIIDIEERNWRLLKKNRRFIIKQIKKNSKKKEFLINEKNIYIINKKI
jgi:hypothetical protein